MESLAANLILNFLQGKNNFSLRLNNDSLKPAITLEYIFNENISVSIQKMELKANNIHEIIDFLTPLLPVETTSALDLLIKTNQNNHYHKKNPDISTLSLRPELFLI